MSSKIAIDIDVKGMNIKNLDKFIAYLAFCNYKFEFKNIKNEKFFHIKVYSNELAFIR